VNFELGVGSLDETLAGVSESSEDSTWVVGAGFEF
jgi:hypothetical protein